MDRRRTSEARLRAEAEVRRQAELLQSIFDSMPVLIAILDAQGAPVLLNREFERVLGWTADDLKQRGTHASLAAEPTRSERPQSPDAQPPSAWPTCAGTGGTVPSWTSPRRPCP